MLKIRSLLQYFLEEYESDNKCCGLARTIYQRVLGWLFLAINVRYRDTEKLKHH